MTQMGWREQFLNRPTSISPSQYRFLLYFPFQYQSPSSQWTTCWWTSTFRSLISIMATPSAAFLSYLHRLVHNTAFWLVFCQSRDGSDLERTGIPKKQSVPFSFPGESSVKLLETGIVSNASHISIYKTKLPTRVLISFWILVVTLNRNILNINCNPKSIRHWLILSADDG